MAVTVLADQRRDLVLSVLEKAGARQMTVRQICERVGLSRQGVQVALNTLKAAGRLDVGFQNDGAFSKRVGLYRLKQPGDKPDAAGAVVATPVRAGLGHVCKADEMRRCAACGVSYCNVCKPGVHPVCVYRHMMSPTKYQARVY